MAMAERPSVMPTQSWDVTGLGLLVESQPDRTASAATMQMTMSWTKHCVCQRSVLG